jgi:glutathione S-transferase
LRAADRVAAVPAKLYWFARSHPALAARKMLELKGVAFASVPILPGTQRAYLRLVGFRGATVPALVLDGRRIQGSRSIARALEQWAPEPPLFPADPAQRARVQEAERWGEQEFQNVPRILLRWGLVHDMALRRWFGEDAGFPAPGLAARLSGPTARYYARVSGADEGTARRALAGLASMLDRVDALLGDGTLTVEAPNAASLQVLCTVRALHAFADLHGLVDAHPAAAAAREVFPEYPGPVPRFIPHAWLPAQTGASLSPPVGEQPSEVQEDEGAKHEQPGAQAPA